MLVVKVELILIHILAPFVKRNLSLIVMIYHFDTLVNRRIDVWEREIQEVDVHRRGGNQVEWLVDSTAQLIKR